jgi:hypothetical protein
MFLKGARKMFNLVKDDFDENMDDIMNSINKILDEEENKENKIKEEKGK